MFANIRNNEIIDFNSNYLDEDILRVETTDEMYKLYLEDRDKVIYKEGEIVENPDYEEIKIKKERERLNLLNLTAADVERAIYKAKSIDFEDIIELVKDNPEIDIKALKIELKANNFYRGNPYINQIGALLGYSSDELDYLFENGELPVKVEIMPDLDIDYTVPDKADIVDEYFDDELTSNKSAESEATVKENLTTESEDEEDD